MNFNNPLIVVSLLLVLGGCATTSRITNAPVSEQLPTNRQQITTGLKGQRSDDAFFFISLSGGVHLAIQPLLGGQNDQDVATLGQERLDG